MSPGDRSELVDRLLQTLCPGGVPVNRARVLPLVLKHLAAAVEALDVGYRPAKMKGAAAHNRARVSSELAERDAHPFGLVPDRTIALVVGCDWTTVAAYRRDYGLTPVTQPGEAPTPDQRWSGLLEVWGAGRAMAWFARFENRHDAREQRRAFAAWMRMKGYDHDHTH